MLCFVGDADVERHAQAAVGMVQLSCAQHNICIPVQGRLELWNLLGNGDLRHSVDFDGERFLGRAVQFSSAVCVCCHECSHQVLVLLHE